MLKPTATTDPYLALGESEAFLNLQERLARAARTDRPVILIGERGTGKELAARRLHLLSTRWSQPYVTLNCAALAPTLLESELFGHEAGAFTGAHRLRKGRFETAHHGSFFLDEIALLPPTAQEKLLRVVEYGRLERVGSSETIQVDVRLIAATNVDLRRLAQSGAFRQDLLDRLSFEVLILPPLRQRQGDILLLARHFARQMAHELNLSEPPAFTGQALAALQSYPWPGNVRELKNVIERMVYRAAGEDGGRAQIDEIIFDPFTELDAPATAAAAEAREAPVRAAAPAPATPAPPAGLDTTPLPDALRAYEIARLREALAATHYHQRKAAQHLGLTYHQLRAYLRKYAQELKP